MNTIADLNAYRHNTPAASVAAPEWMDAVTQILEQRGQEDECLEQLLQLTARHCRLSNVSVAVPEVSPRFKARYCTTGVINGAYNLAVQPEPCR